MSTATPLVFRPSLAQRSLTGLLFAGSWIVGIRVLVQLVQSLPRMYGALKMAQATADPTTWLWISLIVAVAACALGGILMLLSALGLLLVEGTHVIVDEIGIVVDYSAVPGPLARWIGSGRLTWKEIQALDQNYPFFIVRGGTSADSQETNLRAPATLRFLIVDELERLILLILERSPNLRFKE